MLSKANTEKFDNMQICTSVTLHIVLSFWSLETPVGKVLRVRKTGILSQVETRFYLLPKSPDRRWVSPSPLSDGYRGALFRGREADHSRTSSVEVMNVWSCRSTSTSYIIKVWCLIKHKNNGIYTLFLLT
jgi:hypothetical protein